MGKRENKCYQLFGEQVCQVESSIRTIPNEIKTERMNTINSSEILKSTLNSTMLYIFTSVRSVQKQKVQN